MDAATIHAINTSFEPLDRWTAERDAVHLAEVVAEPRIRVQHRLFAIHQLQRCSDKIDFVAVALILALADPVSWVRRDAARALYFMAGSCDIREAAPALRRLLDDSEEHVRLPAAIALSAIGDQTAIGPLISIADTSQTRNSRGSAGAALARLRTPEGEQRMCRCLTDREHAAWAAGWLREMGSPSSLPALKRALRRDPFSRRDYIAAISEIERRHAKQTT